MLLPIQTAGQRPPLFFVHGLHGVMTLGTIFMRAFGLDQPLYVIHANGMDGRRPVVDNMSEMALAYVEDIQSACPTGPIRIGGMCHGTLAAIETARELRKRGRQVGPVILADPPAVPPRRRSHQVEPTQPLIAGQLYAEARRKLLYHGSRSYEDMPFDPGDPKQLHIATLAAIGSLLALSRHVPPAFSGSTHLILSAEGAIGFFHPQMPWQNLLPGPRMVHVLPWRHTELFQSGRQAVARIVKFILEEPFMPELVTEAPQSRISA